MSHLDNQTVQLIITAVVALILLLQCVGMLIGLIIARKAVVTMHEEFQDIRNAVMGVVDKIEPVIEKTCTLLEHTSPKIEATVTDLAAISANLRKETADVQVAANEMIDRFRHQSARVDSMLTKIFDVVDRASVFMSDALSKPMRQVSAVLASAKAVVEALRNGTPDGHAAAEHAHIDHDGYR